MLFALRRLAESATHRLIFRRRLPEAYGGCEFYVTTEGGLRFLHRDVTKTDPMLLDNIKEVVREGDTIWDVGANIGLSTFAAAGLAGRNGFVLAIEPDEWLVRLLQKSLAIKQPRAPIEILPVAISDTVGHAQLAIAKRARASSHLSDVCLYTPQPAGGIRETRQVKTVTLDHLYERYPAPRLIKLDIETVELPALKGAHRLLSEVRPVIHTECYPEISDEMGKLLRDYDYVFLNADAPQGDREPLEHPSWNTLAWPRELRI